MVVGLEGWIIYQKDRPMEYDSPTMHIAGSTKKKKIFIICRENILRLAFNLISSTKSMKGLVACHRCIESMLVYMLEYTLGVS